MRKKEQQLWDTMKRNCPKDFWLQRIENIVGEGIPDVYSASPIGLSTWIELKAPIAPKRETTRLLGAEGLRTGQINWHLKAASKGLRSYILMRDTEKRLFMVEGKYAAALNEQTVEGIQCRSVATSWQGIFEELR